jgi:hypothetical protein
MVVIKLIAYHQSWIIARVTPDAEETKRQHPLPAYGADERLRRNSGLTNKVKRSLLPLMMM